MLHFDFDPNTDDDYYMVLICHLKDDCSDNGDVYVVWSEEECCDFGPGLAVRYYSEEWERCYSC